MIVNFRTYENVYKRIRNHVKKEKRKKRKKILADGQMYNDREPATVPSLSCNNILFF
jgi:hypothetical protein